MLNPELYKILEEVFSGEVRVGNPGQPGRFSLPKGKESVYRKIKGMPEYAYVEDWGEVYSVDCPVCGDTRSRLYFSYLYGSSIVPKGRKAPVKFSSRLCICHNEGCQVMDAFIPYRKEIRERLDKASPDAMKADAVNEQVFTAFSVPSSAEIALPKGCLSLCSENLPQAVLRELEKRRFDLNELETTFFIKYAPAGVNWIEDGNKKELYDDRLLIPIVQERKLVSWQARSIFSGTSKKYLNYGAANKTEFLYNMDNALLHRDVVICEGVTDVWRVGHEAVAMFGKVMSGQQMQIMKDLWGYDGSAVIALDPDAIDRAEKMKWLLDTCKVFPRGTAVLRLDKGDPDSYARNELLGLIEKCRKDELSEN